MRIHVCGNPNPKLGEDCFETELHPEILAFAVLMEQRLRANDHKPGWKDAEPDWLYLRLMEQQKQLESALRWQHKTVITVAATDLANYAMMIADTAGNLAQYTETAEAQTDTKYASVVTTEALRGAKIGSGQAYIIIEGNPIPVPADLESHIKNKIHRRPAPTRFNLVCDPKSGIRKSACVRALGWGGGDVSFLGVDYISVTDTTPMRLRIGSNQTIDIGDYLCQTADGVVFGLSNRAFSTLFDVVANNTESDWAG